MSFRSAVVVYTAATLQGFAFTLVPALATVLSKAPYNLNAAEFGALFVALTLGAIAAATATPFIARKRGMVGVLRIGLAANVIGLAALLGSFVDLSGGAYKLLVVDTAALGLGFGLNFSAVNELASTLSANATRSITIANALTGLGTALTPLLVGTLVTRGLWPIWPAVLVVAFLSVLFLSLGWTAVQNTMDSRARRITMPRALVFFGAAAFIYAFCEGAFSSWATTFAQVDRRFSLATGEAALSGFWLALTGTRIVVALGARALQPRWAFPLFPVGIGVAFFLLPTWPTPALLVLGFIAGGMTCSIVFPYAMSLALFAMPDDRSRVAAVLVGALMAGEGLGTFIVGVLRTNAGLSLSEIYRWSAVVALALAIVALLPVKATPASAVKSSR
jgi:fucose permease